LACALLLASAPALANPVEVLGLTSRRAGQANAGVGAADDASALYYDPAGLVASPGGELVLGTVGAYSHLSINADHASLADPIGFQLALRAPLRLGGALADRLAIGVALHVLPRTVARVTAPAPDEAFYLHYADRLSRMVVLPGAAVRLGHGFSFGAAANILAGLSGSIRPTNVVAGALDARVDERMPARARAIAGVQWQLSRSLRLGAVYRQRFEVPLETTVQRAIAGQVVDVDVQAKTHFTPHQVGLGLGATTGEYAIALDLGWAMWSGNPGPYARLDGRRPVVIPFQDSFSLRAGIESLADEGLVFRGGYGLESSPVPKTQHGVTNLLDGTRHTLAFGTGYAWSGVRLDAHLQVQIVATRRMAKTPFDGVGAYDPYASLPDEDPDTDGLQTGNPGSPSIKSGGEVISAGLSLQVPL
jgi:hypothetical protein